MRSTKKLIALLASAATVLGLSTLPAVASAAPTPASAGSSGNAGKIQIADPQATAQTRALFQDLYNTKAGNVRFGQQHATDEASSPSAKRNQEGDVHELTGKYPAVFGWDISQALRGSEKPGNKQNTTRQNVVALDKAIQAANEKHAIVTLSALMSNPISEHDPKGADGFYDTRRVGDSLLPGGANNKWLNNQLDEYAAVANGAKTADGTPIPIIFRPWLENNGDWYWWGSTEVSHPEFKAIFRYTVDYLRDVKHVHNFLYAYAPDGQNQYFATYPGDAYVDVLGCSEYDWTWDKTTDHFVQSLSSDMHVINQFANKHGKITALTEFGRDDDAHQLKIDGTDIDPEFFHKVRAALMKQAPNLSYMLTWANFGDNKPGRPYAYTPWKGDPNKKSIAAFQNFAKESNSLWASDSNTAYMKATNATAPAAQTLSPNIHLLSPISGWKVTSAHATITVSAKVTGLDPTLVDTNSVKVQVTPIDPANCNHAGRTMTLQLKSQGNGFYSTTFDPAASGFAYNGTWLQFLPEAQTTSGAPISGIDDTWIGDTADGSAIVQLTASSSQDKTGVIDDFDGYDGRDANLRAAWGTNHMSADQMSLVNSGAGQNAGKALNLHYDFSSINYNGMTLTIPSAKANFSGFTHLNLWLKPDGSGHKFVVQLIAGGKTYEAYPDISGTTAKVVHLDLTRASKDGKDGAFTYVRGGAGKADINQKDLSSVSTLGLYVNQRDDKKGPTSGNLQIDSIALSGKRDPYVAPKEPAKKPDQTIDDFNEYQSDADLRKVYVSPSFSKYLFSVTRNGSDRAMEFKANFDQAGDHYLDVERTSFKSADWSGHNEIDLDVKGDGNSHALSLQVFHNSDYYTYDVQLGTSTEWQTVKIPISKFTMNIHKMDNAALENVTGLKIALNRNGDEKSVNGDVLVDNIRLTNSNTKPSTGNKSTVLDDFEYANDAAAQTAWGNYAALSPERGTYDKDLSLVKGNGSGKALHFNGTFTKAAQGNWLDVAKYIGNARKDASGKDLGADWSAQKSMSFDVQGNGSNNALVVSFGTMSGTYFRTKVKLDFTGWKHFDIPLTQFATDSSKNPTAADLKSIKEIVLAANQWDTTDNKAIYSIDNLKLNGAGSDSGDDSGDDTTDTDPFDQEWGVSNFDDYDRTAPVCPVSTSDLLDREAKDNRNALADGTYVFHSSLDHSLVMDLQNGSSANGTNIRLWKQNGSKAQQWKVTHDNNGYVIITNAGTGKALEVYGNNNDPNGSHNIDQWSKGNNQSNQKWVAVWYKGHLALISGLNGEFWGMQFGQRAAAWQGSTASQGANIWAAPLNYDNTQLWDPVNAVTNEHPAAPSSSEAARAKLQAMIDAAQALKEAGYTPVSWKNLTDALDQARSVIADAKATPKRVNDAYAALDDAIRSLAIAAADSSSAAKAAHDARLQGMLDALQKLNHELYTESTWNRLNKQIEQAHALLKDARATIRQIDQAYNDLSSALRDLNEQSTLPDGYYRFDTALASGHSLDVASASHANGANVRLWRSNGTDAQVWQVVNHADGTVTLINAESGKVLDADSPRRNRVPANGANVQQWANANTLNKRWVPVRQGSGVVLLNAGNRSLVLDVRYAHTSNGTNVWLYKRGKASNRAQIWNPVATTTQDMRLDDLAAKNRAVLADGTYRVYSAKPGMHALDVASASHRNGANVRIWQSNGTDAQVWTVRHDAKGYLTLINAESGKALDADAARAAIRPSQGANVHQWDNANTRNQKWIAISTKDGIELRSAAREGLVLDLHAGWTSNGTNIRLWYVNNTLAQRWNFARSTSSLQRLDQTAAAHRGDLKDGMYEFRSAKANGQAVDLDSASHRNGANIRLWNANGTNAQKWIVRHDAKGYVTLINVESGKALDADAARGAVRPANGANIHQWTNAGTRNQKWIAFRHGQNIELLSAASERTALDLKSGHTVNGTNIRLWERNNTDAQLWKPITTTRR